ncbi:hypothetical protein B0H67DRAFT_305386 [Lasiosphaeris hirsuta]|uniref:NAD(P)-binding protein n=1 Tax=Lasiosphaeris hirsuta TaxID=260670 RepID=A0AA40AA26_9PEZI|nr:hypothetical protein B0H67DRAFT_305386 [Lasiosphaeris hirsuta]
MPSLANFIHTQFVLTIPQPSASFSSKTVIITGANGGLGKETAKHVLRLGASKVVLACRSPARGNRARVEVELASKCGPGVVNVWELDLESPSSIKGFVDKANALPRLDVLVNNAGIMEVEFRVVYGTERTVAVNDIGTFLLALQLIPKMKETARRFGVTPHMTFVGSALYDVAKYPERHGGDLFTWLEDERNVNLANQYNLSKLLQLYGAIKLSSIVGSPIVINSMDPCFCGTHLADRLTGVKKVLIKLLTAAAARTAEEGSRLVVQAASAGPETHGLYLRAGAVQKYAPIALDKGKASHVWEVLCARLEKLQPGVLENLR